MRTQQPGPESNLSNKEGTHAFDAGLGHRLTVDIGLFAHNEEAGITRALEGLAKQDIFRQESVDVRLHVLANGCSDATVARAATAIQALNMAHSFRVVDLPRPGKSRSWNAFVHELSRLTADELVFCDADIEIPHDSMLTQFVEYLRDRQDLVAVNSRPVKDVVFRPGESGALDRVIAVGGGSLDDWQTSLCGQLYALRACFARQLHLPIGLPVEDGFVRAMVVTDLFRQQEMLERIGGDPDLYHLYSSERSMKALIRHQVRIVIGSAINSAVFSHLRELPPGSVGMELALASGDETWLGRVIREQLPAWPYGWVPVHFLVKRLARMLRSPRSLLAPKRLLVLFAGFALDAVAYCLAQFRMARGTGVGYW